jgi:hypothetical protein
LHDSLNRDETIRQSGRVGLQDQRRFVFIQVSVLASIGKDVETTGRFDELRIECVNI